MLALVCKAIEAGEPVRNRALLLFLGRLSWRRTIKKVQAVAVSAAGSLVWVGFRDRRLGLLDAAGCPVDSFAVKGIVRRPVVVCAVTFSHHRGQVFSIAVDPLNERRAVILTARGGLSVIEQLAAGEWSLREVAVECWDVRPFEPFDNDLPH